MKLSSIWELPLNNQGDGVEKEDRTIYETRLSFLIIIVDKRYKGEDSLHSSLMSLLRIFGKLKKETLQQKQCLCVSVIVRR